MWKATKNMKHGARKTLRSNVSKSIQPLETHVWFRSSPNIPKVQPTYQAAPPPKKKTTKKHCDAGSGRPGRPGASGRKPRSAVWGSRREVGPVAPVRRAADKDAAALVRGEVLLPEAKVWLAWGLFLGPSPSFPLPKKSPRTDTVRYRKGKGMGLVFGANDSKPCFAPRRGKQNRKQDVFPEGCL